MRRGKTIKDTVIFDLVFPLSLQVIVSWCHCSWYSIDPTQTLSFPWSLDGHIVLHADPMKVWSFALFSFVFNLVLDHVLMRAIVLPRCWSDAVHFGYKNRHLKPGCCFLAHLHQLCAIQRLLSSKSVTIVQPRFAFIISCKTLSICRFVSDCPAPQPKSWHWICLSPFLAGFSIDCMQPAKHHHDMKHPYMDPWIVFWPRTFRLSSALWLNLKGEYAQATNMM